MIKISIQDLYEIYDNSGYYVDMEDTKRNQCICYRRESEENVNENNDFNGD